MAVPKRFTEPRWIARVLGVIAASAIVFGCTVDQAKRHYVLAEKLWTDGKYAAAVSEFDKVSRRDPEGKLGTQALLRAATTQELFLKQYPEAMRKLKLFADLSHDPNAAWEARKQIGDILFNKTQQYDEAFRYYQGLIQLRPQAPEAPGFLYRMGRSAFFLGRFPTAISTYQQIEKDFPKSAEAERAEFEIAQTQLAQGEQAGSTRSSQDFLKTAMASYQNFINRHPQSAFEPEAEFGIASCQEAMDQLDAAFHSYQALLDRYPSRKVIEIKLERIRERKAQRSR